VTGLLSYEVLGWFVTSANLGILFPITIINLAAFGALIRAMIMAKHGGYLFHPSHPRPIHYENTDPEEQVPDEWKDKVTFHPTTVCRFDLSCTIPVL